MTFLSEPSSLFTESWASRKPIVSFIIARVCLFVARSNQPRHSASSLQLHELGLIWELSLSRCRQPTLIPCDLLPFPFLLFAFLKAWTFFSFPLSCRPSSNPSPMQHLAVVAPSRHPSGGCPTASGSSSGAAMCEGRPCPGSTWIPVVARVRSCPSPGTWGGCRYRCCNRCSCWWWRSRSRAELVADLHLCSVAMLGC